MQLLFFCPRWGSSHIPWERFLTEVKRAGFDGVEMGIPENMAERERVFRLLENHGLRYILQHYETNDADFNQHSTAYIARLKELSSYRPYLINTHTGRDFFSVEENTALLAAANDLEQSSAVTILHETHRGRFSYAVHSARRYFHLNWLKLTLDAAHWFCVAESLLTDQEDALEQAIQRTYHIHARIGHSQGPQVFDLRDPRWEPVVKRHFDIWDSAIRLRKEGGAREMPVTAEFGPPPYMPSLPIDMDPQQYQFKTNVEMMLLFKQRYSCFTDKHPQS